MFRVAFSLGFASAALWYPVLAQKTPDWAAKKLAPYVTSPQPIAERMLEVAKLKPGEVVFDLGCGDGRILLAAVRKFGAKAVGVELSEPLVKRARDQAHAYGLDESVKVIQDDMMNVDVSSANVVALYLLTEANDQLRPKLERELKPGARVVSLEFKVRGWKPAAVDQFEAHHRNYTIYLYEMKSR